GRGVEGPGGKGGEGGKEKEGQAENQGGALSGAGTAEARRRLAARRREAVGVRRGGAEEVPATRPTRPAAALPVGRRPVRRRQVGRGAPGSRRGPPPRRSGKGATEAIGRSTGETAGLDGVGR